MLHQFRMFVHKNIVAMFSIATIIFAATLVFFAVYDFPTSSVKSIVVQDQPITSGSQITYIVDQCRFTDAPVDVDRTLVQIGKPDNSGVKVDLSSDFGVTRPAVCSKLPFSSAIIPSSVPSGIYYIKFATAWHINFLNTINKTTYSQPFVVINTADKANQELTNQLNTQAQQSTNTQSQDATQPPQQVTGVQPTTNSSVQQTSPTTSTTTNNSSTTNTTNNTTTTQAPEMQPQSLLERIISPVTNLLGGN